MVARALIPPSLRCCSLAPSITTPPYGTTVSRTLRQPLRGEIPYQEVLRTSYYQDFVLEAKIHSAKVMDWDAIETLLQRAYMHFPRLKHLWVHAGYRREDKGKDWVERTFEWSVDLVECPKKPAPKEVLIA